MRIEGLREKIDLTVWTGSRDSKEKENQTDLRSSPEPGFSSLQKDKDPGGGPRLGDHLINPDFSSKADDKNFCSCVVIVKCFLSLKLIFLHFWKLCLVFGRYHKSQAIYLESKDNQKLSCVISSVGANEVGSVLLTLRKAGVRIHKPEMKVLPRKWSAVRCLLWLRF